MVENPYEPPNNADETATPVPAPKLDENTKEFLGVAKDDFWYYPGFALLVGACFFSSEVLVFILFGLSTVFVLIFLGKSFPKYIWSKELAPITKVYGLFGNLVLIAVQIVVVATKSWFSFSGR